MFKQSDAVKLKKVLASKKRIPAPKALPLPKSQSVEYFREIQEVIRFIHEEIKKKLIPYLPYASGIITQKIPEMKTDAVDDDIARIARAIKDASLQRYSPDEIRRIAKRKGMSVEKFTRQAFERDLKRVAGIDIFSADPGLDMTMGLFANENASLITSLINDSMTKVENQIYQGFRSGTRWETIAADIEKYIDPESVERGSVANRARLIARDQISTLNAQLAQARQTNLGITRYRWRTSQDERVRDSHREKEGEIFEWSDPPADTGHPGEDYNCRCTAEPVLEDLVD